MYTQTKHRTTNIPVWVRKCRLSVLVSGKRLLQSLKGHTCGRVLLSLAAASDADIDSVADKDATSTPLLSACPFADFDLAFAFAFALPGPLLLPVALDVPDGDIAAAVALEAAVVLNACCE